MMMTDCSSIQGSTSSSDITSSRGATPRIRVIRLNRPHSSSRSILIGQGSASYGFAMRGGREFGTGFFISRIERGSEADSQGLRVGDQIIRVNGYHVDDAVHKELSQFISNQDRLTLKVRGVGMIPVKERAADSLSWHIVPLKSLTCMTELEDVQCRDIRVTLCVAPRTKLGLGICKGPEWKPGIFVQFTKEAGVARDAGLRPGDQLLSCNGIDFSDILFSEAVAIMKATHTLELFVRTAAGLDLFPGESSGYNSSASSVTGDQSPCWGDQASKRLSIVREEANITNNNNKNDEEKYQKTVRPKSWDRTDLDRRKDKLHPVNPPKVPQVYKCQSSSSIPMPGVSSGGFITSEMKKSKNNNTSNTTIIKLSENGTVINNTLIPHMNCNNKYQGCEKQSTTVHVDPQGDVTIRENSYADSPEKNIKVNFSKTNKSRLDDDHENNENCKQESKIADICFVSRQSETKTVIVEVHRGPNEQQSSFDSIPPPPPSFMNHGRSPSTASSSSLNSSNCGTSLSSAISEELKRRAERSNGNEESIEEKLQTKKKLGNPLGGQNDERHNALMDEFKRAHRKMFKNNLDNNEITSGTEANEIKNSTNLAEAERQSKIKKAEAKAATAAAAAAIAAATTTPTAAVTTTNGTSSSLTTSQSVENSSPTKSKDVPDAPKNHHPPAVRQISNRIKPTMAPPPPPFPFADKIKPKNGFSSDSDGPPATPIPDYDSTPSNTMTKQQSPHQKSPNFTSSAGGSVTKGTMGRVAATEIAKANGELAEMESIESFKLTNPSSPIPRPPSVYFAPQSQGPPTMKKTQRPVSVTIGEYGVNHQTRKEPTKFDFIPSTNRADSDKGSDDDVSQRLRNELEMTLSRSNLKKKTDMDNIQNTANGTTTVKINHQNGHNNQQNGHNQHPSWHHNGSTTKPVLQKTQSSNIEKLTSMLSAHQLKMSSNGHSMMNGSIPGSNRITISIPSKPELRKTESSPPNGILKNSLTNGGSVGNNNNNNSGVVGEHKNISFGNITTVIGDT